MSLLLKALQNAARNREAGATTDATAGAEVRSGDGDLSLEPIQPNARAGARSASFSTDELGERPAAAPSGAQQQAQTVLRAGARTQPPAPKQPGFFDWLARRPLVAFSTAAGVFAVGYGAYLYVQITNPGFFQPGPSRPIAPPVASAPPPSEAPNLTSAPLPSPPAPAIDPPASIATPPVALAPGPAAVAPPAPPPAAPTPGPTVAPPPALPGPPAATAAATPSTSPAAGAPPVSSAAPGPQAGGIGPAPGAPAGVRTPAPAPAAPVVAERPAASTGSLAPAPSAPAATARASIPPSLIAPAPAVAAEPIAPRPRTAAKPAAPPLRDAPPPAPQVAAIDTSVLAGYQALEKGQPAEAERAYRQALATDARNADAMLGLAAALAQQNKGDAATQMYLRVLENDPRNSHAQAGLLNLAGRADPAAAEARLKQLIARDPSAFLYFSLGNLYAEQGHWAAAQSAYFQAHNLSPDNPDYAFNLAVGLEHLSQPRIALDYYRRAVALAQARGHAQFELARVENRIRSLEAALALRP